MKYLITNKLKKLNARYLRRKHRVNTTIKASNPEARVIINKSNTRITAQLLDAHGRVLARVDDSKMSGKTKTDKAHQAGVQLAKDALAKQVEKVVFDRNGHLYHGRVKAIAEGLREGGLSL